MNRIIGISIKRLRIEKKLSQNEVAQKLGYSQSMWSKIEQGQIQLRASELHAIAHYFNAPMDVFFENPKAVKDDILYNLQRFGINTLASTSLISGEKRALEELVLEVLKNPRDVRYLECLPALVWKHIQKINFDTLIDRSYHEKLQNRLGFIIDVTMKFKDKNKKLRGAYDRIKELKIAQEDSFYFDRKFFSSLKPLINDLVREWHLYDRFDLESFRKHFV